MSYELMLNLCLKFKGKNKTVELGRTFDSLIY